MVSPKQVNSIHWIHWIVSSRRLFWDFCFSLAATRFRKIEKQPQVVARKLSPIHLLVASCYWQIARKTSECRTRTSSLGVRHDAVDIGVWLGELSEGHVSFDTNNSSYYSPYYSPYSSAFLLNTVSFKLFKMLKGRLSDKLSTS